MYNLSNSITIEKDGSYTGRKDTFSIKPDDKSISVTHKVGGFMHKKVKPEIRRLSHTEFQPISDAFENLDFTKIFKESDDFGCDGWTLRCTISNVMSKISVEVWCLSEDPEKHETTKLLQACYMIFNLFPIYI